MFGGNGGFCRGGGYGNNLFANGIGELASDQAINQFVYGGLNTKQNILYLNKFQVQWV